MTISINTKDYIKTYDIEIDGELFHARLATTSETITLQELRYKTAIAQKKGDTKTELETLKQTSDLVFSLFGDAERARKVMRKLSFEDVMDIYQKAISGGVNNA